MKNLHSSLYALGLILVIASSILITSYISFYAYRHMPHIEDEVSQCFQAKIFASGRLWVPEPANAEFFRIPEAFVYSGGKMFSQYPYGHSAILAIGYLIHMPWLIPPVCSSLALAFTVAICRGLYGVRTAILIPFLCLSSPFFLFLAGSYMNHTTCLLFVSLFLWFFFKYQNCRRIGSICGAAIALGLAFCTRPFTAICVGAPFVICLFITALRPSRRTIAHIAIFCALLACGCFTYCLYNYLLTGDIADTASSRALQDVGLQKFGGATLRALGFGQNVGTLGGHSFRRALFDTNVNLANLMIQLYGWPVWFTLAFLPIPFILKRARAWDWLCLIGISALPAGYFFYFHYGHSFGPRYWFESLPFLLILTARGIDELASLHAKWRINPAYPRLCVYTLVGFLICNNLFSWVPELPDKVPYPYFYFSFRPVFRDLIRDHSIHNAVIFVRQRDIDNYDFITAFELNAPDLHGDIVIARDLGTDKNKILMEDYPGRNYFIGDWTEKTLLSINP